VFGIRDSGFRVRVEGSGLGFRVYGSLYKIWGSEDMDSSLGFRV
jgi:hypothetical protein